MRERGVRGRKMKSDSEHKGREVKRMIGREREREKVRERNG